MRVDGKFLAVDGKSIFDGTFTAVTQHDGTFLAVDGDSSFDGKSPLYRDRPPVRYFYVGKLPNTSLDFFLPLAQTPQNPGVKAIYFFIRKASKLL